MLDPLQWRPRLTVVYNKQARNPVPVQWQHQSRLTKIEIGAKNIKSTWNKAGGLLRLHEGDQVGQSRYIRWGNSYQVWPNDLFYPYTLVWTPVPWFPNCRVRFYEYTGTLTATDLIEYLQLDDSYPNAELTAQIEILRQQVMLLNPAGTTTKEKATDFLQSDNQNRVMVAANADRNGGLIFNKGSKALWVGFGVNAEKSSQFKVMPGGQLDIPNGFTGVINGLFDAASTVATDKGVVVEMVAQ